MKTKYCNNIENIENYESAKKDNFKGWVIHHRLETHTSEGERRLVDISKEELKALGMYYHRPSEELIFMITRDHLRLHRKGKHLSKETKRKLSEINKGEDNPNYGKSISEEQKIKISNSMRGHKGNGQKLADVRKVKKWGYRTPLYTSEFFANLDPNISHADFNKYVSKSFCIWKKFQKYLEKD